MEATEKQADTAVRFYTSRATTYDMTWHSDFCKRFASYLTITPGQQILDLACGTGLLTFQLATRVGPTGRVVGVDITPTMLSQATAKKAGGGDKYAHVELYKGDILDLEGVEGLGISEGSFDIITVASALVLLPDPKATIKHWARFLKPGGILATDSTHPRNLVSGIVLERTARRLNLPSPYYRTWSTSQHALKEVLEAGGLEVEDVVTVEDQAGYGRRHYEIEDWDDHFVEKVVLGDTARTYSDPEVRRKAQAIFKEEWEKLAVNGRVEEIDSVYLGIGRKPLEASKTTTGFSGGCRCGSVKYTTTSVPTSITLCHCRACQHLSGSAFLPFCEVPDYSLTFSSTSTLKTIKLSPIAERKFCTSCGSPISMKYSLGEGAEDADATSLTLGSVDPMSWKGEWPKVKQHIFLEEKAPWFEVPDDGAERQARWSDAHLIEPYAKPK